MSCPILGKTSKFCIQTKNFSYLSDYGEFSEYSEPLKEMSNKSPLRMIYEQEYKPVCDRTWARIKRRLDIKEPVESSQKVEVARRIKAYVYLRKRYPNREISRAVVDQFAGVKSFLSSSSFTQCTGKDIYSLIQRLDPRPSDSTVYRWGEEIGLKFSMNRVYVGEEVDRWVEKIVTNPRHRYSLNKIRKYEDDGQNQRVA